ncbi:MAG: ligand-binding sensor domain-containing protein, partial [Cyclobacteriaceae bacterium]
MILSLALSYTAWGQGEQISFQHLGPAHGLSQNSALCLLQDQQGFIWIGTEEGLNRYDGHNFKIYKTGLPGENFLSHSIIWSLHEDRSGILWVGTRGGGLNHFDRVRERFTWYRHDSE